MDALTVEFWSLLNGLLGNPAGSTQTAIYRVVGFVVMMFVFEYAGHGMGANKQISLLRVLLALLVGMLVLMVTYAATRLYIMPHLPRGGWYPVVLYGVTVVVVLLVAVPLQCLIRKSKYVSMVVSFGSALLVVFLVMFALNTLLGSVLAGGRRSDSIRERKHMTEKFFQ